MNRTERTASRRLALKLWFAAVHFAVDVVLVAFVYFVLRDYLKDGEWKVTLYLFNKSLANAAALVIGLSMLLSSLARLRWVGPDKLAFRKHLGVVGFGLAVLHVLASHRALGAKFPWPAWIQENGETALLGSAAFVLFAAMTAVSNRPGMKLLGGAGWRRFLSWAGYVGLALVLVHASWLKWPSWLNWVKTFHPWLPSLSLPTVAFGLAVLAARLAAPRPR